jgi:DNA-binding response OmpR family regulator
MKRILVITGMGFVGEMLRSELIQEGYRVVLADSEGVLSSFIREAPDLILVDTVLNPQSGEEQKIFKSLRNTERPPPILIWSVQEKSELFSESGTLWTTGAVVITTPNFSKVKAKIRELLSLQGLEAK